MRNDRDALAGFLVVQLFAGRSLDVRVRREVLLQTLQSGDTLFPRRDGCPQRLNVLLQQVPATEFLNERRSNENEEGACGQCAEEEQRR